MANCPKCRCRLQVIASDELFEPMHHVFRRRMCTKCGQRYNTREILDHEDIIDFNLPRESDRAKVLGFIERLKKKREKATIEFDLLHKLSKTRILSKQESRMLENLVRQLE